MDIVPARAALRLLAASAPEVEEDPLPRAGLGGPAHWTETSEAAAAIRALRVAAMPASIR